MRKGIYQIIDELKEKPTLTLSEINDICNEFSIWSKRKKRNRCKN